ncbi:MAG: 3-phosphoshikimate 1-carboxyvinyltransferase [Thermodesulfobacteriota bacterium]|nr:3-phosphoshikimate 1-carboxyvinyltransferase [Thermodesulfobacteriota bacterium]
MREIQTKPITDSEVTVPGSKSYTHRSLIAAALSDGTCRLANCLDSEDTRLTRQALSQMGVDITDEAGVATIVGTSGRLAPSEDPVYLGNSGTSMRLLAGIAALGSGLYTLSGTDRMAERPVGDLLDALTQLGVNARSVNNNGCPPIEIQGGTVAGGKADLKCGVSSQYLSSLLLAGPYMKNGLDVTVVEGPVSKPYIDMTVDIMTDFEVTVDREGYNRFRVPPDQCYKSGSYRVESDASQASYFWAAAAITGTTVKVRGMHPDSRQGDVGLLKVLAQMGCTITHDADGAAVTGGNLSGVTVDMADMPDVVPTLAVVAAFAKGVTRIYNVAHLKEKESDRLSAVATELTKMGIAVVCGDDGLTITGGDPKGAEIETYNDHRIAMCFAVAGLRVPGVKIRNEQCVEKSFPDYWDVFETLY